MTFNKSDNHSAASSVPPMVAPGGSSPSPMIHGASRIHAQNMMTCVVLCDYLMMVVFLMLSGYIRFETAVQHLSSYTDKAMAGGSYYPAGYYFSGAFLLIVCLWQNGLYHPHNLLRFRSCVRPILVGLVYGIVGAVILVFFFKIGEQISRLYILLTPLVVAIGFLCWRWLLTRFFRKEAISSHLSQSLVFIGWTDEAQKLYDAIRGDAGHPYRVVGYIPSPHHIFQVDPPKGLPMLGDYNNLREVLKTFQIEIVVLADLNPNVGEIVGISNVCEKELVQFKIIPSFFRILLSGLDLETISGVPILGVAKLPLDLAINRMMKRVVDVIGALVGLVFFGPLILIFGLLVYIESPGPIIYRQRRVGRGGNIFYIYKIRSMQIDADRGGDRWTQPNDPRRLRVGTFMRAWNIDELPQFWNVLKGDMSLVGPRPETADLTRLFKEEIPHYNARHGIKPGISGWAQVNGLRGNTDLAERIRYDLYYLENWSIWLDFQIMFMTFLTRANAY